MKIMTQNKKNECILKILTANISKQNIWTWMRQSHKSRVFFSSSIDLKKMFS